MIQVLCNAIIMHKREYGLSEILFMIEDFNFTEFLQFLFVFNSDVDTNAIKTFLAVNDREAKKLKADISRFKPFQCIMKTEDKYLKFNSYKYFEE